MNTEELSNRLTQILTGITRGEPNPNIIQGFVQNFIEDFKPDYYYEILVTDVEGYTPTLEEQKQILMLAQKAFDLMPSQCTLMYLAAAYARNNNFRQAYECLASMPFYGAPVLSSAVYHLLNLKRIFPSTKK